MGKSRSAHLVLRTAASLGAVAALTYVGAFLVPMNTATIGFAYLLLVLLVGTFWGFLEAGLASIVATLTYNYFFLPPVGTLTIAEPENWVALFSFLTTSLIASRLSTAARRRAQEAVARQLDLERLYSFSRAILLIEAGEPFARQLAAKLAEIFELTSVVLYDRRSDQFYRGGPFEFEGVEEQLRESAWQGAHFHDSSHQRVITAVRLGTAPIASLAIQGGAMPDSLVQGIANLVAIGLERARAQEMAHQIEAARQSEELRTTLIDAMSHEFKTPLTSIKAATTALLSNPEQHITNRTELIQIADEEANHLEELIDDAVEMARLDSAHIDVRLEMTDMHTLLADLLDSMRAEFEGRRISLQASKAELAVDRRLMKLAVKQLLSNALKYSPPGSPIELNLYNEPLSLQIDIVDHGAGIPGIEQSRIFERFYRSPSVKQKIPGSGLGLSIAHSIARAHRGDLTMKSRTGETTFRMRFPKQEEGARA